MISGITFFLLQITLVTSNNDFVSFGATHMKHASIRWWIDIFLLHACVFTDLLVFGILVETESKCFPPLLLVMEVFGIFILLL
jgi:hypothetical protein